jgi:hypothetical protein
MMGVYMICNTESNKVYIKGVRTAESCQTCNSCRAKCGPPVKTFGPNVLPPAGRG